MLNLGKLNYTKLNLAKVSLLGYISLKLTMLNNITLNLAKKIINIKFGLNGLY
jgi:hypothetical protein